MGPMVRTISAIAVLLIGHGTLIAEDAIPCRLRVLCYNIHHGAGVDRKLDLPRIARVITSLKPDIVSLQEVDQRVSRTNQVDQPAELARLTKMKVVFGDNIEFGGGKYGEFGGGKYGNAILSNHPIVKHRNHRLPNFDDGEQRGVLEATIRPAYWTEPIVFLATHLDHRPKDRERFESAKVINRIIEKRAGLSILAGDLNDTIDSRTLVELKKRWSPANKKPLPTVPVKKPSRQIDFILIRPPNRLKVVEVRVLSEAVASDHRAIFAVFEIH
ncbi:MAG: endonuclease [Planctomycetaceae bacterium]|nr:endonuclease [Planctomycetaceae bacterium]